MQIPLIIYGEPVNSSFFDKLLDDKNSKYLTDFKRYFNYLKKNNDSYKHSSLKDKISIDRPLYDYVSVINDWLEHETDGKYTICIDQSEHIYFGFKFTGPTGGDIICKIVKDWNKKKELRDEYFEWISMFEENAEGPIFAAVY